MNQSVWRYTKFDEFSVDYIQEMDELAAISLPKQKIVVVPKIFKAQFKTESGTYKDGKGINIENCTYSLSGVKVNTRFPQVQALSLKICLVSDG